MRAGGSEFDTVSQGLANIRAGAWSCREWAELCLARAAETGPMGEAALHCFAHFDADAARARAVALDQTFDLASGGAAEGPAVGALFGAPIGVKDIFDTADAPTENGFAGHRGRRPGADAAAVRALRDAGAVIFGKCATTELAAFTPGPTRNPAALGRTPGGSSSGSAAAVAAGFVVAALGSQTAGSVIRPASFCGVYGYKPSFGLISRAGCLAQAPALDTVGVFARSVADLAAVASPLVGHDPEDAATETVAPRRGGAGLSLVEDFAKRRGLGGRRLFLAPARTPRWDQVEPAAGAAFEAALAALRREGIACGDDHPAAEPQAVGARVWSRHRTLMLAGMAENFGPLHDAHPGAMSPRLAALVEEGRRLDPTLVLEAARDQAADAAALDAHFDAHPELDALLTLSAPGPAPLGLESTGDPVLNLAWTFLGAPCVGLPRLRVDGAPLGLQLVGRRGADARLLAAAAALDQAPAP